MQITRAFGTKSSPGATKTNVEMDALSQLEAEQKCLKAGLKVLGWYPQP
jgi:hypothetical protein